MPPLSVSPVRLTVAPDPAHVRVARLVTVSLARMTGLDEEGLDEVRLATSEAVGRAVAAHRANGLDDPIEIEVSISRGLQVRVYDRVALAQASGAEAVQLLQASAEAERAGKIGKPASTQDNLDQPLPEVAGAGPLAVPEVVCLIDGLADESSVATGPDGTVLTMRWRRTG